MRAELDAEFDAERGITPRLWAGERTPRDTAMDGAPATFELLAQVEAAFRGAVFGTILTLGIEANLANIIQTLLYVLTTRLGAPGRDRYLLVLTLAVGFIGGWLTASA